MHKSLGFARDDTSASTSLLPGAGGIASHPFANCAKGWGTPFRAGAWKLQVPRLRSGWQFRAIHWVSSNKWNG